MFRLLILLCVCSAAYGALPKGWKACSMKDDKYSECLATEIMNAVRSLESGNKKLGVLSLDPLKITELIIGKGSGPVAIELQLRNLDIHGIKMSQIKSIKNDWKTMHVDFLIPVLEILSDYKVDGKVLVLPIVGEGKANMTYEHLKINTDVKWKVVQKGNTKYINMESLSIPFQPKRLYLNYENLFNGDEALGDKKLGVLPLDPLRISKLEFATGDGPISIQFFLRDADLYGLKNIQVINVKNDWKTMNIKIFIAPELQVLLNGKVDGVILLLPIKGEGRGNITFEDLSVDAEIHCEKIKKGNIEYFNMELLSVLVEPKNMTINLDNLFDGNKALSDQTNIFLNENWMTILDAKKGLISGALSTIFKQIANQVLSQIPANEIDI